VLPCSLAASYQCFEEAVASIFRIIQGESIFLKNTANDLQNTQHRIPEKSNEQRINKHKIKFKKGARIKVSVPGCVLRLEVVIFNICCAFSKKNFK
jgi:hypothetical protein